MKLLIIGHARHGKDTVCEMLRLKHGYSFRSSSNYANEHVIYPALQPIYKYKSLEECYEDRVNHRRSWYNLIRAYNGMDPARLARDIISEYDIYCGLRHREEFVAAQQEGLFDYVVWVDRSKHISDEPSSSMTLTREDADIIIDNNGSLSELETNVDTFVDDLMVVY